MNNVVPFPAEAGARAAPPYPQDASSGMATYMDGQGNQWAYNPATAEWQRTHVIQSGDTLWKLSGTYYTAPSLGGVRGIFGVPQNKAIQGDSPDIGLIPGDIILIPGLPQPAAPPGTTDEVPIGEVPQVPPAGPPDATLPGSEIPGTTPLPGPGQKLPGTWQPPDVGIGLPVGYEYPGVPITEPGEQVTIPGVPITLPETEIIGEVPAKPEEKKKFWTPGKTAVIVGAGVLGVGLIWALTRKGRRRR